MSGLDSILLCDEASGSTASILPSLGFNCYAFRPVIAGDPVEVLWATPDFGRPGSRPSRSGIPILFPFAGRLRGQSFIFRGQTYEVNGAQTNNGNAIHGFLLNRPWRVVEQAPKRAVGEFQASIDEPALLNQWPADFRLRATYTLDGATLRIDFEVVNPDDAPLPFALGAHPYFRLPLGQGDPAVCRITVPAAEYWDLADGIPTGRRVPVDESRNLTTGRPFGETDLDAVLTDLRVQDGQVATIIEDPGSRRTLTQTFDASFRHCVVFTPPHREAIAIEPYTCIPNLFALEEAGARTGLQVLDANESFSASIQIRLT